MSRTVVTVKYRLLTVRQMPLLTTVPTITVGNSPFGVGVNPITNMIYVSNNADGTVTVIDGISNSVLGLPIGVGINPQGITVNPMLNLIYVTDRVGNQVSVIDGATNTVIATIAVGGFPFDACFNPSTNLVYVTNNAIISNSISVLNYNSLTSLTAMITIGTGGFEPTGIGANPLTNIIYVANPASQNVGVIDGLTQALITIIPISGVPFAVGILP